jgi:Uma2 family endonuclease
MRVRLCERNEQQKRMEVNGAMRPRRRGSLELVSTIVHDPQPAEFEALLERRRLLGQDRRDELWKGVYRMNPPPSHEHQAIAQQLAELLGPLARRAGLEPLVQEFALGEAGEYLVPDGGLHRPGATGVWHATAALAIEILSPADESWEKLEFYAAHDVDEVLILDPQERLVHWLALQPDRQYRPIERSALVEPGPSELAERIDWPR